MNPALRLLDQVMHSAVKFASPSPAATLIRGRQVRSEPPPTAPKKSRRFRFPSYPSGPWHRTDTNNSRCQDRQRITGSRKIQVEKYAEGQDRKAQAGEGNREPPHLAEPRDARFGRVVPAIP